MSDPHMFVNASVNLAAIAILSIVLLSAWRGWLDLKRTELSGSSTDQSPPSAGARIELADLKERIRKLEAIANGIET